MNIKNKKGDRLSPWIVPLLMRTAFVLPIGSVTWVVALVYMSSITLMASVGKPRSYMICSSLSWSMVLNAELKDEA